MKKVLLAVAVVLFAATSASAMPIMLNPDGVLATTNGMTGIFDQLGIYLQTTSIDADGAFADVGDLAVQSLIASGPVDGAGLNSSWYLVGGWNDIQGYVAGAGQYVYTSGTMSLYVTEDPYNFGTSLGAGDDSGFSGIKVADLSLVNGLGFLTYNPAMNKYFGAVDMTWEFTSLDQNFWRDADGNPIVLDDLSIGERLFAFADVNTDRVQVIPGDNGTVIYSDHNGSVSIGVVPEPASMTLFGIGLVGAAAAGIRRKFQA